MFESMAQREGPKGVPVLSRGKHRSPRKGACFMEYASLLAGERWSDHPRCTHPLLASVARGVNDYISDAARTRLVELIPSVIGVTGEDPKVDARIAMRCAAIALPVVAEHRQRALAVGLLAGRHVLADVCDPTESAVDPTGLFDHARRALAAAPHATRWAEDFFTATHLTLRTFQRRSAPAVVRVAVTGIAEACVPDRDGLLYELLTSVILDCTYWLGTTASVDSPSREVAGASPGRSQAGHASSFPAFSP